MVRETEIHGEGGTNYQHQQMDLQRAIVREAEGPARQTIVGQPSVRKERDDNTTLRWSFRGLEGANQEYGSIGPNNILAAI